MSPKSVVKPAFADTELAGGAAYPFLGDGVILVAAGLFGVTAALTPVWFGRAR